MARCLVIGNGIAGMVLARQLQLQQCTITLQGKSTPNASQYAAGILNPTVLKRYTSVWNATAFHTAALPFYLSIEKELETLLWHDHPIHRLFYSQAEHNAWTAASGQVNLQKYLVPQIKLQATSSSIKAPFGYGKVQNVGRLDIQRLLSSFKNHLGSDYNNQLFDYKKLRFINGQPHYQGTTYDHLFFCEGYDAHENPFFDTTALIGSKGEMLIIKSEVLPQKNIWKGPVFLCPLGNHTFWVGASFDPKNKQATPSPKGRQWLLEKLHKMITAPFEVLIHQSGIRPTTKDRRPLLGTHPTYKSIHIMNGLGTRGVLMAPLLAQWLCASIFDQKPFTEEVAMNRFAHLNSN